MKKIKNSLSIKIIIQIISWIKFITKSGKKNLSDRFLCTVKEHYYEKKLGINTGGSYVFKDDFSTFRDGNNYEATPYFQLEKLVNYIKPNNNEVFIDIWCGKGRVVFFCALYNFKKVIGIELIENLALEAKLNLNKIKKKLLSPVEIYVADAATFNYEKCTKQQISAIIWIQLPPVHSGLIF